MPRSAPFKRSYWGLIGLILLLAISCQKPAHRAGSAISPAVEKLLKRKKECRLSGGEAQIDTAKYTGVWNAAYAYDYSYPKDYSETTIDNIDKNGMLLSDTAFLASPDKHATIKIWVGETISFPLGAVNGSLKASDFARADAAVEKAITQIKQGKYPYLKGAAIDELCHGLDGYNHSISVIGHTGRQVIVYKIQVSEIPVSGDLLFKNLVFTYDKGFDKQYRSVAITVANDFGNQF